MVVGMVRPMLLTGWCIEEKLFILQINIFLQVFAQVQAVMIEPGIRVLHSFTIKDNPAHQGPVYVNNQGLYPKAMLPWQ